ncbi:MAG TPA: hypothetical protein VI913_05890 [Candidatus Peribacteraceae bacterium]|nr:hypothetical protein [Candidatus Peribacteraceae bacterium]
MPDQFLSIKEAADRYQKAEITIRRLVRSIVKESQNQNRNFIFPSETEAVTLRKQKKPFSYGISVELLEKVYSATPQTQSSSETSGNTSTVYVALLAEQMKVKDEQIRALTQALDALTERQRETNILMKGLQERFLLPEAKPVQAADAEESIETKPKSKSKKAAPQKRSGWWLW